MREFGELTQSPAKYHVIVTLVPTDDAELPQIPFQSILQKWRLGARPEGDDAAVDARRGLREAQPSRPTHWPAALEAVEEGAGTFIVDMEKLSDYGTSKNDVWRKPTPPAPPPVSALSCACSAGSVPAPRRSPRGCDVTLTVRGARRRLGPRRAWCAPGPGPRRPRARASEMRREAPLDQGTARRTMTIGGACIHEAPFPVLVGICGGPMSVWLVGS